ncbi:trypsin-like serine peptidase [Bacillus sp. B-jedd]|uniref:trypsin-like serine peptidase n=1 Tax=Bacillus sp. B-jedd TaxID=1476857 RepID=UPI0005156F12|nr:trypsin-like serine protease [Bacillus sp. B-jedd]CEG26225.1 glutamyl endopeptidase [Bacillus sp. B-jedd]
MKKVFVMMVAVLVFLVVPLSSSKNIIFAQTINSKESIQTSPYDLVSSKGEIIRFKDYSKLIDTKIKASKPIIGTGQVLPERDLKKNPNKPTIDLGTGIAVRDKEPGTISTQVVLGTDGRQKVSDTSISPYRQIAYIELEYGNSYAMCTGTVIGYDYVLTNAHCVRDLETNTRANGGYVIPALTDNHYSYGAYEIENFYYPNGYDQTGGASQYDYAVIKLAPYYGYEIGEVVGALAFREVTTDLTDTYIKIFGYPGDKIISTGLYNQWGMSGNVTMDLENILYYTIDTAPGQSGSAILDSSNQVVGVHNAGYDFSGDDIADINGGPKMTSEMSSFIRMAALLGG